MNGPAPADKVMPARMLVLGYPVSALMSVFRGVMDGLDAYAGSSSSSRLMALEKVGRDKKAWHELLQRRDRRR
jgi:hypothetical protein